jgi:type IV secretion system protein TrbC
MAAATKWKSFIAEFFKPHFRRSKLAPKALPQERMLTFAACIALADELFAQSTMSPWTQAVQVLQTASAGPIATGLALVAILVGGLMFAFGEGAANRDLVGMILRLGMASKT